MGKAAAHCPCATPCTPEAHTLPVPGHPAGYKLLILLTSISEAFSELQLPRTESLPRTGETEELSLFQDIKSWVGFLQASFL